ncbi:hypothetical protein [Bosea thiooxidans]
MRFGTRSAHRRDAGRRLLSVTVDAEGFFTPNALDAYSHIAAKKSADGRLSIPFGGCDRKIANCLSVTTGWNSMIRLCPPLMEPSTAPGLSRLRSRSRSRCEGACAGGRGALVAFFDERAIDGPGLVATQSDLQSREGFDK